MLGDLLFSKTAIPAVMKSLDAAMMRTRVISNNVANITTPGYQRQEVSFEDEMRKALDTMQLKGARTQAGHLPLGRRDIESVNAEVQKPNDPVMAGGVNNVDIDEEMAKLAESQVMYNFGIRFARDRLRILNAAIRAQDTQIQ
ncbi:MAG: flagellar basal body rod protein FlgB [Chitinivibrionales bacterium]|nr:flagellar basal body rod protein FlgB [Chitinivibrionales bacterium]